MEWLKIFGSEAEARKRLRENKPQLLIVNKQRICLVLHNDAFFAVQDACTHHGESLSKGTVNAWGEIICPWHHYRFHLDNGKPADSTCAELTTYPVKAGEDGLFIAL